MQACVTGQVHNNFFFNLGFTAAKFISLILSQVNH